MTKDQLAEMRRLMVSLKRDVDTDGDLYRFWKEDFDPVWEKLYDLLTTAEAQQVEPRCDARIAPWHDFKGALIREGDEIVHPDGQRGKVVFLPEHSDPGDQWRVNYGNEPDGGLSRLCLQIGDKGQAVVTENRQAEPGGDRREDRAYYNGARQAAAMAHQSLQAMDEWINAGCGGRGPSVNRGAKP